MNAFTTADTLHRLVKEALDSGAASSVAEAEAMFGGYKLVCAIGADEAGDADHQAALLTAVALGRRVFLGGVHVTGPTNVPLAPPLAGGGTLAGAIARLGGMPGDGPATAPTVMIGGRPVPKADKFQIRTEFGGWRGGVVPAHWPKIAPCKSTLPLSPMLAAALAVNEAFMFVRGGAAMAGRRAVGLSLWDPSPAIDWTKVDDREAVLAYLPARLWLIGLGHLGQAYLWALGLLPYRQAGDLELVLQDVDVVTPSTESTSVLSDRSMIGQQKTRTMAAWAEGRGFRTRIYERLFDASFRRQDHEPCIALCGLDNALGRRALDQVGFQFVVEAGLGRDHRNFQTMRIHTLPAKKPASEIWPGAAGANAIVEDRPAYQAMMKSGQLDQCGVTLLAGKAVGAPFVGAVAACLAVSEVLRLLHGGPLHQLVDLDLKSPEHRSTAVQAQDFSAINPGFVGVSG